MLWIPELARSAIRNSSERAAAWRPPVRRKDRLPHHEHAHPSIRVPRQQLLSCGAPPQTGRSRWRKQQNQPRNTGFAVECFFEVLDI